MFLIKFFGFVLFVFGFSVCVFFGQLGNCDNEVKVVVQKFIGQFVGKVFELFGKFDQGFGFLFYGSGGFYVWNCVWIYMGLDKVFIQIGIEYVGQCEIWVGVGGQGVVGMVLVSSEVVYCKVGYYENEIIFDYFCSIILYIDSWDIIINVSVIDCWDSC